VVRGLAVTTLTQATAGPVRVCVACACVRVCVCACVCVDTQLAHPLDVADLAAIVRECRKHLQLELSHFSPVFRHLHPSPDAHYINRITQLISQDHASLQSLQVIDDDVMACLREMEAFDDYVIAYAQRDGTTMEFSEVRACEGRSRACAPYLSSAAALAGRPHLARRAPAGTHVTAVSIGSPEAGR
jgi:hypothetical protein